MSNKGDADHGIDKALVRDLAELLKETDLTEIEVEAKGLRIRVSRAASASITYAVPPAPAAPAAAPGTPASGIAGAAPKPEAADPSRHPGMVPSPMVGTAYRASEPTAKPFVSIGQPVKEGETILIIEAMKHMNEVTAPRSGTVTVIFVEDGQPVEYGEPLMIIE